jgi:hypothetical protein
MAHDAQHARRHRAGDRPHGNGRTEAAAAQAGIVRMKGYPIAAVGDPPKTVTPLGGLDVRALQGAQVAVVVGARNDPGELPPAVR